MNNNLASSTTGRNFLTREQLQQRAPAVFADKADSRVSSRYAFAPTTQVVDSLANRGWYPVFATQTNSRDPVGKLYAKHLVRYRQQEAEVLKGQIFPEIVHTNSHDRTSGDRFFVGLFIGLCNNGLVVSQGTFESVSLPHLGEVNSRIIDISAQVLDSIPNILNRVETFKAITLNDEQRFKFARAALELRYDKIEESPIKAEDILRIKRIEEQNPTLWNTFNVIQENVLRGGVQYRKVSPHPITQHTVIRRSSTRAISSVSENVRINRKLWELADTFAVQA